VDLRNGKTFSSRTSRTGGLPFVKNYLKHLNPDAKTKTWVAEDAVRQISGTFGWASTYAIFDRSWCQNIHKQGLVILNQAKRLYSEYLQTGQITKNIIRSSILLAQLDKIYREGRLHRDFGMINENDVTDLENLINLVNPGKFATKNICLLNPTFGKTSNLVGGADADLFIDGTLIDIKTTKYLKFDRLMFNQLVGYYFLHKIGGIGDLPGKHEINKLGIYYSRHGELFTFDTKDLMLENDVTQFLNWFKSEAKDCFGG